jgi:hypothetical protein
MTDAVNMGFGRALAEVFGCGGSLISCGDRQTGPNCLTVLRSPRSRPCKSVGWLVAGLVGRVRRPTSMAFDPSIPSSCPLASSRYRHEYQARHPIQPSPLDPTNHALIIHHSSSCASPSRHFRVIRPLFCLDGHRMGLVSSHAARRHVMWCGVAHINVCQASARDRRRRLAPGRGAGLSCVG